MQHSYLLDTHNVTFDCGIETLYYYGGEPCIGLELMLDIVVIGDSERIIVIKHH